MLLKHYKRVFAILSVLALKLIFDVWGSQEPGTVKSGFGRLHEKIILKLVLIQKGEPFKNPFFKKKIFFQFFKIF